MTELLTVPLAALVGTLGFSLIFHSNLRHLPYAVLGGFAACVAELLLERGGARLFTANFAAALLVMLYAELCAKLLKAPNVAFLLPAVIPLVPGSGLFYAMEALIRLDGETFRQQMLRTGQIGFGIAGGIVVGSLLIQFFTHVRKKDESAKSR